MKHQMQKNVVGNGARASKIFARRVGTNSCAAFSLVEVTLALGIVGFCLTVLLGLLGSGISMSRSAMDRTISAQIAQRLIGMAQQTDWSQKAELEKSYFYFDGDGQPLDNVPDGLSVFSACVLVDENVELPSDGAGVNDRLATVRVRVVRDPGRKLSGAPAEELADATLESGASEFAAFLANNGA